PTPPPPPSQPHSPPLDERDGSPTPPPPPEQRQIAYQRCPQPQINIEALSAQAVLPKLKETMEFVAALASATLKDPVMKLSTPAMERIRNPPRQPLVIDNPGHWHSISVYLATEHSSEATYNKVCQSTTWNFSDAQGVEDILLFHEVENLIATLTG
ncbi:hypothetical protein SCLCIDRAFT_38976, partial [Scleroderma citrinum Foug A]